MLKKIKNITISILLLLILVSSHLWGADPTITTPAAAIRPWGFPEGDIQGDLYSGSAAYQVPIVVPKGINGLMPELTLSYSNQRANSPYGVGWDLPIGTIWRDTSVGAEDIYSGGKFLFEIGSAGGKLVSIGGGGYRAKVESAFLKFSFDGSKWTIKDKNGTTYLFETAQSGFGGPLKWFLDRTTDVRGNYIKYIYSYDGGQPYISQIEYCRNDALSVSPVYKIIFTWEGRPDTYSGYTGGTELTTSKRLQRIDIKALDNPLSSYLLTYETGPISARSLLKSVRCVGSDGTSEIPPVTFSYNTSSRNFGSDEIWYPTIDLSVPTYLLRERFAGDFNGDGKLDICAVHYGSSDYARAYVYLSDGNRLAEPALWSEKAAYSFLAGDFNGDKKTDILYTKNISGGFQYWALFSTGYGFQQPVLYYTWTVPEPGGTYMSPMLADVNGDGLTDLIIPHVTTDPTNSNRFWVYLNTGITFSLPSIWLRYDNIDQTNYWPIYGDVNSDGLADMVRWTKPSSADYFNIWVLKSTGLSFTPFSKWGEYQRENSDTLYLNAWITGDLNHDGIGDHGLFYAYGINWANKGLKIWNSTTRTFDTISTLSGVDQPLSNLIFIGDFDGDGIDDYGRYSSRGTSRNFIVKIGLGGPADLLIGATNRFGGTTSITYKPSTKYDNTGGDGIPDLPFPVQTAESITTNDGMGNVYTTSYSHANGAYSTSEKEFRGFGYSKVTNPDNTTYEVWYYQDDIFKGKPYKEETKDALGNLYQRIEYQWQNKSPLAGVNYPYLAQEDAYIYDGDADYKHAKETYDYDNYGNRIKTVEWGEADEIGDERTALIDFFPNETNWIIGSPARERLFANATGTGVTLREALYCYDHASSWETPPSKGEITKIKRHLDHPESCIETNYDYDPYGNRTSTTDHLGHATFTYYDTNYHVFPSKVTNAKGHDVTMTYYGVAEADGLFGQINTITDSNSNTTTYKYDKLGRLVRIIGPYDSASAYGTSSYQYGLNGPGNNYEASLATERSGTADYQLFVSIYDGFGRKVQQNIEAKTAGQFTQVTTKYNNRGQVDRTSVPKFITGNAFSYINPVEPVKWVSYLYDTMGRPTTITNPDSTFSSHTYDDWTETVTDENSHQRIYTKDAYGRLSEVKEKNGAAVYTTIYRYNMADNLFFTGDNAGNVTTYGYDSLGRKLTMHDPDMGIWDYEYDALGNLKKCTDANGEKIYYDYDELNRLIKKSYESLPGETIIYTYDGTDAANGIGRRTAMYDFSGSAGWSYDAMGRVASETKNIDGEAYDMGWAYDAMGRITSVTYPNGEAVDYAYDAGGNIENLPGYASELQYNALGQMTNLKFGNDLTRTFAYYPDNNRLMSIVTPSVQSLSYTYDLKGNVKSVSDALKPYVKSYDYDDLDRMMGGDGKTYEYNSIGNITKADSVTYYYDPAHVHALANDGVNQYTYDDNGNMLTGAGRVISYDPENRPLSVTKGSTTVDFVYDGDGSRVKKVVHNGAATKTTIYIGSLYEKEE